MADSSYQSAESISAKIEENKTFSRNIEKNGGISIPNLIAHNIDNDVRNEDQSIHIDEREEINSNTEISCNIPHENEEEVEDIVEDVVEDKEHQVQKNFENPVTESTQSIIKKKKTSGTFIPTLQSSFHHTKGNSMDSYRNSNNDNNNDIIIHNKSSNNSSSSSGENSYDNNYSSSSREDDVEVEGDVEVDVEVSTGSSVERNSNNEEENDCVIHKVSTFI